MIEQNQTVFLRKTLFRYHTATEPAAPALSTGTLQYTLPGLISTMTVLCLGTGIFTMMQVMLGNALPLIARGYGANNQLIALLGTTIPYVFNMIITPIVSFRSDRTRTKIGRRMPYLLFATPFMALALIGIGWIEPICRFLESAFSWYSATFDLWILGGLIVFYNIFYLIIGSIIYYLFPDVIPDRYIGRFMALLQLSGSLVGFLFSRYLLKFVETCQGILFTSLAFLFAAGMLWMIFTVREGEYPEVDPDVKPPSFFGNIMVFVRECYSIPFYYCFFLTMALSEVSMITRGMFNLLYAKEQLHISVEDFGIISGWFGLVGVVLSFPLGILVDKLGSLKVFGAGLVLVILTNLSGFFLVRDYASFYVVMIVLGVVYAIQMTSTLPVFVDILPKEFYGQFSAANALFRALFMTIGSYCGGLLFDLIKNYQYIFAWDFLFTVLSFLCFVKLYRDWRKRGGRRSYVAPLHRNKTSCPAKREPA